MEINKNRRGKNNSLSIVQKPHARQLLLKIYDFTTPFYNNRVQYDMIIVMDLFLPQQNTTEF